jgi:hypothetical protein
MALKFLSYKLDIIAFPFYVIPHYLLPLTIRLNAYGTDKII